uniref:(northern house mosquito) hypothetical protein n=1 Tax=Culex pipiens TaxID=7175 RepID=A0A8D8HUC3_CULPI
MWTMICATTTSSRTPRTMMIRRPKVAKVPDGMLVMKIWNCPRNWWRRFPPAPPATKASTPYLREDFHHRTCGPSTPNSQRITSEQDRSKRPSAYSTIKSASSTSHPTRNSSSSPISARRPPTLAYPTWVPSRPFPIATGRN